MNTLNVPVHEIKHLHLLSVKKPGKYFCTLCRESSIRERKAHLVNFHKADRKAMNRPSSNNIIKVLFIEHMKNGEDL